MRSIGSAEELERRRRQAVEAVNRGETQATVANVLGVAPNSVYRWVRLARKAPEALAAKPHPGPKRLLSLAQEAELEHLLLQGAQAYGWPNDLWTAVRVTEMIQRHLDTFGGNSGSPVLTADHRVCGIFVRGEPDCVRRGKCVVATSFPLNHPGESVCRATVWSPLIEHDKWANLREANSPEVPQPSTDKASPFFRRKLEEFLLAAFSPTDLRQIVKFNAVLESIENEIPWHSAYKVIVSEFADSLAKKGLVDAEFFEILQTARPRRIDEIRALREEFGAVT